MTNYPYILKTGSIKKFLEKIPSIGVPDKVNLKLIYTLDFRSTNDRAILAVLKFLKFVDDSGVPTDRYKNYRDKSKSSSVLANSIREAYYELFKVYSDAYNKDHKTLQNFFSTHTSLGERAVKSTVETFKALCSMANFEQDFENVDLSDVFTDSESKEAQIKSTFHNIDFMLSEGRKVKIILPQNISEADIEKIKKLLDAFK